jgi:hypothetical protein
MANLTHSLNFYRMFIARFLDIINHKQIKAYKVDLRLDLEIGEHEVKKLRRFTESVNSTYHLDFMSDVTEILKSMMLRAHDYHSCSKTLNLSDRVVSRKSVDHGIDSTWSIVSIIDQMPVRQVCEVLVGLLVSLFFFISFCTFKQASKINNIMISIWNVKLFCSKLILHVNRSN